MMVRGLVIKVRQSSFADKKTGQLIPMLYVDLLDDTAGLVQVEMRQNGSELPLLRTDITAQVTRVKKIAFGSGVSFVVSGFNSAPVAVPAVPAVPVLPAVRR